MTRSRSATAFSIKMLISINTESLRFIFYTVTSNVKGKCGAMSCFDLQQLYNLRVLIWLFFFSWSMSSWLGQFLSLLSLSLSLCWAVTLIHMFSSGYQSLCVQLFAHYNKLCSFQCSLGAWFIGYCSTLTLYVVCCYRYIITLYDIMQALFS